MILSFLHSFYSEFRVTCPRKSVSFYVFPRFSFILIFTSPLFSISPLPYFLSSTLFGIFLWQVLSEPSCPTQDKTSIILLFFHFQFYFPSQLRNGNLVSSGLPYPTFPSIRPWEARLKGNKKWCLRDEMKADSISDECAVGRGLFLLALSGHETRKGRAVVPALRMIAKSIGTVALSDDGRET